MEITTRFVAFFNQKYFKKSILLLIMERSGLRIKKAQEGQRTPVGNDRGKRWLASSPELCGQRQIVLVGSGLEAMPLGVPWMSWRHPAVRQGQHRRGYSGRTSERSHHVVVGRDTFEVQGDEKLGLPRS